MKTSSVAYAKAHFSAVLAEVEAGEDDKGVVITRRGMPVARIVPEPRAVGFDWAALRHWVSASPTQGLTVTEMRERDLL
ncbi:type II toxin-antitoxin system Phd/YefM family antitoxin [Propionivibrio sp.]|uniref:type II toxin-antitoxin system Phd/YefM family antitoxin n=1 Tax=Propionivibrio sp. TaxID=2212460 RepID=UPI003BF00F8F